jgi:hypothetical protein
MCIRDARRGDEGVLRDDDEEERAADEATFREANERIRQAQRELNPPAERIPFLCECEEASCHEPIKLSAAEYELVRDDPTHFVIVSGHPTHGELVSERDGYAIVRKTGRSGAVAAETDPRKEEA